MELSLEALAQMDTPCYVFRPELVIEDYQALREALGTGVVVSFKANPLLDLYVRCSHAFVDGVELASLGELNTMVGRASIPRFVNTPALDKELLVAALACRATVVLDNAQQVAMCIEIQHQTLQQRGVWLRLNAASLCRSERLLDRDHFGMDLAAALRAACQLHEHGIAVHGLHVHGGSNSFARFGIPLAMAMREALARFANETPQRIGSVNLGGGIPANWRAAGLDFTRYREAILPLAETTVVMHEAGRAIFSRAGAFVSRILALKSIESRTIAICDGGIAHAFLLAQTEQLPKKIVEPRLVRATVSEDQGTPSFGSIQLVGNSCNRSDTIGLLSDAGFVAPNDYLVFEGCGAYHTYSPVKFLSLKPATMYVLP